jgi:hypothetical protein
MRHIFRPPRLYLFLGGLLVVQVALSVVVFWPRKTGAAAAEALFPDVSPEDIVELTVSDDTGNSLHLALVGGAWVLADADGYPARLESVTRVLEALTDLQTGRLVTRTEPSHRSLQVAADDFLRRIVFKLSDGSTHAVYLGSSPRYGATHVRVFGQDEVYLTSDLLTWDVGTAPGAWVDTTYVSVPREEITSLKVTNANGTFELTQGPPGPDGEPTWSLVGLESDDTLDDAIVNSLVSRAATVNMAEPLGKEERASFGLAAPSALVTIDTADETIAIAVGASDAEEQFYTVKASTSAYYASVSVWSLRDLVEYSRDDLLLLPGPEEEAGAESPE